MNTIKIFKQNIIIFFLIDFIYFLSTSFLLIFSVYKLQEYIATVTALAPKLQEFQNLESMDLVEVNNYLDLIDSSSQSIITITVLTIVGVYLLYCFFQSLQFRLAFKSLKQKIKLETIFHDHFRYFLKFLIINIPLFILFIFLLTKSYSIVFIILLILLIYFVLLINILLNKFGIVETLKKVLKVFVKSFKIFPLYLLAVASTLLFQVIHPIAALIVFILVLNYCRIFFTSYVEKLK